MVSVMIEIPTTLERRIARAAARNGVGVPKLVEKLLDEHLSHDSHDATLPLFGEGDEEYERATAVLRAIAR